MNEFSTGAEPEVAKLDSSLNAREEFVVLFSQHSRRIYSFILTLAVRPEDADEIFQNTSLVLWKKHDLFISGTSFWAWACQVAYYEVLHHRGKTRDTLVFSDEIVWQLATEMLAREDQLSLRQQALHDCLERLDSKDRDMIQLRYLHEKAPKQIAVLRARSLHWVYRTLSRIHELLHRCIERALARET